MLDEELEREGPGEEEEPDAPPRWPERVRRWIERKQVWLFVPFFGGVLLWPFVGPRVSLGVTGGAIVAAGLVPIVTLRYRTRLVNLRGFPAVVRGLLSVGLGAAVIALGWWVGGRA